MRIEARIVRRVSPAFALDVDLALDLPPERPVAALFGPSGCGKSSTLAAIAGLTRPDGGCIAFDGAPLFDSAAGIDLPPERRAVGLVPQDGLLFPHLDVEGNLRDAESRAHGRTGPGRADVVAALGLTPLLARRAPTLSGGERQRVALARALLAAPRLLLLDEPVSALDEAARVAVLDAVDVVIRTLRVPTLFVSHQTSEVLRLATVAARMDGGRVVATGDAAGILASAPASGPVWNLLRVRAAADDAPTTRGRCGDAEVTLPQAVPPGAAVLARISSGTIALEPPGAADPSSARNHLAGRVAALHEGPGRVRITVDTPGAPLQVDLTPASARTLGIAPGVPVVCIFKAHALELVDVRG